MKKGAKFAEYIPTGTIILGFGLMAAGWNGAAGLDYTQGQVPYLISGGFVGMGFVFFGSAAMLVRAMKKGQARQEIVLRELTSVMKRTASTISFSTNGHATNGHAEENLVVVGASSFHLPNCRMVGPREAQIKVSMEEAIEEGLEPCRICSPLGARQ